MIGDTEAEDAYDVTDPIGDRLRIIGRIVDEAQAEAPADPNRSKRRRRDAVRLLRRVIVDLDAWSPDGC